MNAVSPTRVPSDTPDAVIADSEVGAVLDFDHVWDTKSADCVDEVDESGKKRRLQHSLESCRSEISNIPANVFAVIMSALEPVQEALPNAPKAIKDNAADVGVTMADALKRAREQAKNSKVRIVRVTEAQEKMNKMDTREVGKLREERVEETFYIENMILESWKPFNVSVKRWRVRLR